MKDLLVACLLLCGTASGRAQFSEIIVFGDSLSDVGNLDSATFGLQPGSDYFDGRFSNGPLYSELLAEKLSLGPLKATSDDGTNYAFGGARTSGTPFFEGGFIIDDLDEQIDEFFDDRQVKSDELYVVFAGSNDFILGEATDGAARATRVLRQIDRLVDAGAEQLLSINLPLLGETPDGRGNAASLNARAEAFNATLATGLDALADPKVNVFRLDLAEMFSVLLEEPAAFGFTNTTGMGISAANSEGYLFWDDNHPTTHAHALIAEAAFRQVQAIHAFGGDFDFDGELTRIDVDLLSRQVAGDSQRLSFDLDQSGGLDPEDVDQLLAIAMRLNGDADFNGEVGFTDFLTLSRNFGRSDDDTRWSAGDFNSNGEVGFPDFLIFSGNFGQTLGSVAVPEPATLASALLFAMLCAIALRRRRNGS